LRLSDSGASIRDDDGNIIGVVLVFRDVSEEYKLRQQVDASEKQFRDLYENAPNAYFSIGVDGIVHMCNKQAGKMLGYQVDDITGRQILDFYADTPFGKKKAKEILQKFNSGGAIQKEELQMQRAEGTLIWISLTVNAVRDSAGKIIESRSIAVDITEKKATDIALQKSKDLLEATGRMARVGGWELDAKTLEIAWTTETYRIHEVSFDHKPPLEEAIHFFHPEDREKLSDAIQRSLQYGEPYDMELRFITAKGKHLWTRMMCRPVVVDGKTVKLFGTFQDITRQKLAEIALHHEKETAQKYLEIAGVIIVAIDRNAGITLINKKGCEILGYEHPELIGKNWFNSFVPGNIREDLKKEFKKLISGEKEADDYYENPVLTKQHEKRLIAWHNALLRDNEGNIIGTLSSGNDITERKKLERTIRKNRERLARAQQIAHLGNWEWDIKKESLIWSEELYRIFGISKEFSLTFEGIRSMIYPEDKKKNDGFVNRLLHSVDIGNIEFRIIRPDQSVRYLYQNVEVQRDKNGEAEMIFGIIQDITERRQAEIKIRESEEKFRNMYEHSASGIAIVSLEYKILNANNAYCTMLGYSEDELQGKTLKKITHPETIEKNMELQNQLRKGLIPYFQIEKKFIHKDGHTVYGILNATSVVDTNGNPLFFIGNVVDITTRKEAEKQLIKAEKRFKALIENAPDAVAINDDETRLVYASPNALKQFGYKAEEMMGHSGGEFTHPDDIPIVREVFNRIVENPDLRPTIRYRFRKKNGEYRWVETTFSNLLDDEAVQGFVLNFTDITEKKLANDTLLESERGLKEAQRLANIGNWSWDFHTDRLYLSDEMYNIIGLERNERALNVATHEKHYTPKSWALFRETVKKTSQTGESYEIELEILEPEENKKYVVARGEAVFGKNNEITGLRGTLQDITDRKIAENELKTQNEEYLALNEELEEHMERIKKMNQELDIARKKAEESDRLKSSFLANMSHEIRTPMNGIIGFAGMFTKKGLTDDKRNYYAKIVIDNSKQLLTIVNDILDISRIEAGSVEIKQEEVNVNDLINSLYAMYKPKSGDKLLNFIPFKSLTDNESVIISDKTRLKQALDNLLNNAFKFTHEGEIQFGYELQDENIGFYVTDTGIGIAREQQDKIFEQFRQEEMGITRQYGGTGLGLAICKKLVNLLGGDIRVESVKGKGSSFYFTIPYKPVNQLEEMSGNKKQDKNVERFTILVAEDEEINYLYVEEELTGEGIQLILAKNGKEAVDMTRDNPGIDLILMDIKMPALDGLKATKMIKEFRPGLPIIAYTAYVFDNDKAKAMEAGCDDYLTKPLDIDRLRELIEKYKKNAD
jgi:PAS domain S-box-containing protein